MIPTFSGKTANDVWISAARAVVAADGADQPSRTGPTRELLHAVLEIEEPRQRWIPSRLPPLNPAFAIVEALWILLGRNDEALPLFFNPRLPQFNGPGPVYGGAYGARLRRVFGVDQLRQAADALAGQPNSRQVVLQIWDAKADLPNPDGTAQRADIPCNVIALLKVRGGRLLWTQVLRSNDLVLGVPYNIVQFTVLQEVLSGWLGLELGPYVQLSESLHAYTRDLEDLHAVKAIPVSRNADSLAIPFEESKRLMEDLEKRLDTIIRPNLDRSTFQRVAYLDELPLAYRNHLAIVIADAARRRRWIDLMEASAEQCANPALRQMWDRWVVKQESKPNGKPSHSAR